MYIRTKDGVFELVDTYYMCVDGVETYMYDNNGRGVEIRGSQILKQSENLEELCDGFYNEIEDYEFSPAKIFSTFDKAKAQCDLYKSVGKNVRLVGFIKTDNCLKFVAKMNDEGDLELL